jgi:hypothetical protein
MGLWKRASVSKKRALRIKAIPHYQASGKRKDMGKDFPFHATNLQFGTGRSLDLK